MTVDAMIENEAIPEEFAPYRAVSRAAIVAFIISILSFAALLTPVLLVLPLFGLLFAVMGLLNIRRYPLELTGKPMAWIGAVLCSLLLVGGSVMHSIIYATEVPEGYARISFNDLQPTDEAPDLPVSPRALELNGEQVFIKGYVYPDGQQYNIRKFVLIPDMGTCCFGGQPKLTDMVQVTLKDPLRIAFARRKRKLAGILKVDTQLKPVSGVTGVYYQMSADYVR